MHKHKIRNIIGLDERLTSINIQLQSYQNIFDRMAEIEEQQKIILNKLASEGLYKKYLEEYPNLETIIEQYSVLNDLFILNPTLMPLVAQNEALAPLICQDTSLISILQSNMTTAESISNMIQEDPDFISYISDGNLLIGIPKYNNVADGAYTSCQMSEFSVTAPESDWEAQSFSYFKDWTTRTIGLPSTPIEGFPIGYLRFSKYFIPATTPSKIQILVDDNCWIYLNGRYVGTLAYNAAVQELDIASYILQNQVNHLCISCQNTGENGTLLFGFV